MKSDSSPVTMKENGKFSLPVGPSGLCFDRHEFLENSFSVDRFLHDHRKKANLETIRDDLGVYLKVLRSAMIELINKDYADFVNLSSNLIGLDKAIHSIQVPLGQLKEEVLQVKQTLDDSMSDVSEQLNQRRLLHSKKHTLKSLSSVRNVLQKLNNLLLNADKPLAPDIIERAASEYNRLQFAMSKCGSYRSESITQDTERICDILTSNLNKRFLRTIKSKSASEMAHCLRIYVTLDKISYVEDLFKKEVIATSLSDVICENNLSANSQGLQGVYAQILSFVEEDMSDLLGVTCGKSCQVAGYDFLVNSLWPEVEHRLEINLSSIYAPGNPEIFYKRYCETMAFLDKLDGYFSSSEHVDALHHHPQYKAFLERWNLPVYFQIRFQEIAGSFEATLMDSKSIDILESPSGFHVLATSALWNCLIQCWADGIFLNQLGHRFWKLNLQLLARYCIWVQDNVQEESSTQYSASEDTGQVTNTKRTKDNDAENKIKFLVHLYLDLQTLAEKISHLEEKAFQKFHSLSTQSQSLLRRSFSDSKQQILDNLPVVSKAIVRGICEESLVHLRQVSDIPRLFRRTNREAPTKPCAYVAQVLMPSAAFLKSNGSRVDMQLMQHWLAQSFSAITEHYYGAVNDVLTSVQKTEESLRKLKKLRDRSSAPSVETRGSDDEKIRKQLVIDVQSYSDGILGMKLKKEDVQKLENLIKLVTEASNASVDSK